MKTRKLLFTIMIVSLIPILVGCMKIVKIGEEDQLTGEVAFNAGDSVAGIWDTAAVPELCGKAIDLKTFLEEADGDYISLDEEYGKYSMGSSGELSYTVKGISTIKEINTDKKAGYIEVELEEYSGNDIVRLQIGPVFKGSAVRDSLDFIKFEDYKNQVDYAAVSQGIHDIIQTNIIEEMDFDSIIGKKIEFTGCFTVDEEDMVLITPVQLIVH